MTRTRPEMVLILDDDEGVVRLQERRLQRAGFATARATTPEEALALARAGGIDLLLLDNRLGGSEDGLEFYNRLQEEGFDLPVILVTGHSDDATIVQALRAGVRDYIFKSVEYLDYLPDACRRVLDQVRVKRELLQSEDRMRLFIEHAPAALAMFDRDMRYLVVSQRWITDYRLESQDVIGRSHYEVFPNLPERWRDAHRRGLAGEVVRADEDYVDWGGGHWLRWELRPWYEAGGKVGGIVVFTEDTTDRKKAQDALREKTEELKATTQQLWQAARLAGVGELAASIAHELNNPLATVSLRLEGVLGKTPATDPRRKPLEIIEGEVTRMARLVGNLLNFSRAGRDQVSTVDVCEEVAKTIDLTEHHLRKRQVRVDREFAQGVPVIFADRQQLRQVFLNLLTNAADAMSRGGKLAIRVRPGHLPDGRSAVAVEVSDSGIGIPPEHLPRVFDAFFTTKEEGKGTGLGLAICKRIVDQHCGRLEVESEVGRGTTVRVILPVRNDVNVAGLPPDRGT